MNIFSQIALTLKTLPTAARLAPLAFAMVIAFEGIQHIAEWQLGMFGSREAFTAMAKDSVRLSFGVIKALGVALACYFIPRALTRRFGPPPVSGSFTKDFMKKLWDPRGDIVGMFGMMLITVPFIAAHYALNFATFGSAFAPFLLIVDSLLVGGIALVLGTSFWASNVLTAQNART